MFDRSDAGADGAFDPFGPVRMCGDERLRELAFLDGSPELGLGELREAGVRPGRQHRPRREHLDEVRSVPEDLAHVRPHLIDPARHAEPQLPRDDRIDIGRQPGEVAAPARARHVGARAQHPGAIDPPRLDRISQRDIDERAERSDVADGRETGEQRVARVLDPGQRLLGTRAGDQRRVSLTVVLEPDQMAVRVDETGQQRRPVQPDHAGPSGISVAGMSPSILSPVTTTARFPTDSPRSVSITRSGTRITRSAIGGEHIHAVCPPDGRGPKPDQRAMPRRRAMTDT
jgi:hypothetical protein